MAAYQQGLVRLLARIGNATRWAESMVPHGVAPVLVPTFSLGEDRGDAERRVWGAGQTRVGVAAQFSTMGIFHAQRELELLSVTFRSSATVSVSLLTTDPAAYFEPGAVDLNSLVNTDPQLGVRSGAVLRVGHRLVGTTQDFTFALTTPIVLPLGLVLPVGRLFAVGAGTANIGLTCGFLWRELGP
jgi:hypothetical protein